MSYSGERFIVPHLKSGGLAVSECGITENSPGHSCGPRIYGHYSAHFVLSGRGVLVSDGVSYQLSAGEGFMIMPDSAVTYTADRFDPWTYVYVNFSGAEDDVLVHSAGISEDKVTFSFDPESGILKDLERMHSLSRDSSGHGYDVTGCFLIVMSYLVREETKKNGGAQLPEQYVRRAVSLIENNYDRQISVNDIARRIGVDRTCLYRAFKKDMGTSPVDFLINYRLERAVVLMDRCSMTASAAASAVGFCDASHFSRAFKKKFGVAPGQYMRGRK